MFKLLSAFILFSFQFVFAQEFPPMVEVGSSARFSESRSVDAVFHVKSDINIDSKDTVGDYFVIAHLDAKLSTDKELGYMDVRFNTIGVGVKDWDNEKNFIAGTLLNVHLQKDFSVNNRSMSRITFIGIYGGLEEEITENLAFVLNGVVDILGYGVSERLNDGLRASGTSSGADLEVGAIINKKFRVTFQAAVSIVSAKPEEVYMGYICHSHHEDSYYDNNGFYHSGHSYTTCQDEYHTYYHDQRIYTQMSLNLAYQLNKNTSIYSRIGYSVFKLNDQFNEANSNESKDSAYFFMFGVRYNLLGVKN